LAHSVLGLLRPPNDGRVGLTLPNQWSPRLGAIWDPTREGRAKVLANFARLDQAISLNMADRAFPGGGRSPWVQIRINMRVTFRDARHAKNHDEAPRAKR
jgi:hypothetical protein